MSKLWEMPAETRKMTAGLNTTSVSPPAKCPQMTEFLEIRLAQVRGSPSRSRLRHQKASQVKGFSVKALPISSLGQARWMADGRWQMVNDLLLTLSPLLGLWSSWYRPLKLCHHAQSCYLTWNAHELLNLSLHSQETYKLSQTHVLSE